MLLFVLILVCTFFFYFHFLFTTYYLKEIIQVSSLTNICIFNYIFFCMQVLENIKMHRRRGQQSAIEDPSTCTVYLLMDTYL